MASKPIPGALGYRSFGDYFGVDPVDDDDPEEDPFIDPDDMSFVDPDDMSFVDDDAEEPFMAFVCAMSASFMHLSLSAPVFASHAAFAVL